MRRGLCLALVRLHSTPLLLTIPIIRLRPAARQLVEHLLVQRLVVLLGAHGHKSGFV